MKKEYEGFVKEMGGLNFDKVSFRSGALTTCEFGLVERYKTIKDRTIWGYPGIHSGIDRGHLTKYNKEMRKITVPFDFVRGGIVENDKLYGTQVFLYHKFGFRIFVAHMYPDEILIKDRLAKGFPIYKDTELGDAGSNGFSTGIHTHTEVEAWGDPWVEECDFLEELLLEKYGAGVKNTFSNSQAIERYKSIAADWSEKAIGDEIKTWSSDTILTDFKALKKLKNVVFINDYKIKKSINGKISTFYNSNKLFGF
jgi:hypothetical protein